MVPTMKPVSAEDAASTVRPWVLCSTVMSQDCTPAPAIDDTMKKPKNSMIDGDKQHPRASRPRRCAGRLRLALLVGEDAALPDDRQRPPECRPARPVSSVARQPISQMQRRGHRRRGRRTRHGR